jgi:diadenylate cyclase
MIIELLRSLRMADVVDILLVSILLYALLVWLRRTASVTVLVGTPIVAAIYIAAESFGMYLTSRIFHGLFAVVSIGLIILFQDDLRRTLGRRVSWWWLGKKDDGVVNNGDVDGLVEAMFSLAGKRTGALVVLVGRESVMPHIEGGIVLQGRFSVPLLQSIFEPHSPGHDGAVVIENGLVKRFAVHLPLSRNFDTIGRRGTRHSAALGLAERCDALVIVVSEERGTVSVARDRKIETLSDPSELKDRILRFQLSHVPQSKPTKRVSPLLRDMPMKFLAVALAFIGWVSLAYQPGTVERTMVVPIEYRNVKEYTRLDGTEPSEARVTFSGRQMAFNMLDPAVLKISIDLRLATIGDTVISLNPQDVERPFNLTVTNIDPSTIRYRLESDL